MRCKDKTLYTGITTDLERRFKEHQGGKLGAKYTKGRVVTTIEYSEEHSTRSDASVREYQIKKLSKAEKLALINTKD